MNFLVLQEKYSIYKFKNDEALPGWVYSSDFYSITNTKDEQSVVTIQSDNISETIACSKEWRILKIQGPLDFSLVGIIADISNILKNEKISIFTISTYDTDYILVRQNDLDDAIKSLRENGHLIFPEESG